jgi:hypothetical protein
MLWLWLGTTLLWSGCGLRGCRIAGGLLLIVLWTPLRRGGGTGLGLSGTAICLLAGGVSCSNRAHDAGGDSGYLLLGSHCVVDYCAAKAAGHDDAPKHVAGVCQSDAQNGGGAETNGAAQINKKV